MNRTITLWIVLAGAAAAGAIWFLDNYERVPEQQWVGYSGEARRNQYLAAERLLARMGVGARHVRSLPELKGLAVNATLILPRRRDALTPDARLALLRWVDSGGHLIVEGEDPWQPDPLLDALGVQRRPAKQRRGAEPIQVKLPHAEAALTVELPSRQSVDLASARVRVEEKGTTHLLHFARGRGRVTVASDLGFARNHAIGHHDHAEFVWQIVRFQSDTPAVFVFDDPRQLSLLAWLRDNAWAALAGAAILLTVWLWRVASRFGPVAPDPEPVRRRLLDHLRASGRFQWSRGGAAPLVEAAREAALRRVARAYPDFGGLTGSQREARLDEVFGIPAADAAMVLAPVHPRTPRELIAAIGVYQRIHEQLSGRRK